MSKKDDFNRCIKCGSVPVRDFRICLNICPNCGYKWTDTFGEAILPIFWKRPVKVQFD